MKKLWIAVVGAFILGGAVVLGGVTVYNSGVKAAEEKAQKVASEKKSSEKAKLDKAKKSSEKAKKESKKKASEKTKKESKKEPSEKKSAEVTKPKSTLSERSVSQSNNTEELYTSDGVLKYATLNTDYVKTRKMLLERWGALSEHPVTHPLIRLSESNGGFMVSSGKVPFGKIVDNGDGTYDFQRAENMGGPFTTIATERVD